MAQLGDMRFDCPVCGKPVTVPVREIDGGQYAVEVTADLSVIRRHMASVHPELAAPAEEAATGEQTAEAATRNLNDPRRGPVANTHTFTLTFEASGEVTPAPQPDTDTDTDTTETEPEEAEQ